MPRTLRRRPAHARCAGQYHSHRYPTDLHSRRCPADLVAGPPSLKETELGAFLDVSRTVVREALISLEDGGMMVTHRGIGRFVTHSLPHVGR